MPLYNGNEKRTFYQLHPFTETVVFEGEFSTWDSAVEACGVGHAGDNFFEGDKKIINDFQRGIKYLETEEDYMLLYYFLLASIETRDFRVIDYGGALGNKYYAHRVLLEKSGIKINWIVVEQSHYVEYGRCCLQDGNLQFVYSMEEACQNLEESVGMVLFGSVLQFLDGYEELLEKAVSLHPKYIVVDSQPMSLEEERIVVERLNHHPYFGSGCMPCRITRRDCFVELLLKKGYRLIAEHDLRDDVVKIVDMHVIMKRLIFELEE